MIQFASFSIGDFVFSDFNTFQSVKVFGAVNSGFSEVWWYYPSADATENNKYVVFNYLQNAWYIGTLNRTAWCFEDDGLSQDYDKKRMFVNMTLERVLTTTSDLYVFNQIGNYTGAPTTRSLALRLVGKNVKTISRVDIDGSRVKETACGAAKPSYCGKIDSHGRAVVIVSLGPSKDTIPRTVLVKQ